MSITITTLNNEAAAAKTFELVTRGDVKAVWRNATDSTASLEGTFSILQKTVGKTKTGVPIRLSTVVSKFVAPTTVVLNGNSVTVPEEVVVTLNVRTPTALATLTATQRKDLVAFIRNFATAANVDRLAFGEN